MATLSEAQAQLAAWEAASLALAEGKSASFSNAGGASRSLTVADADEVQRMIAYWERKVASLSASSSRRIDGGLATFDYTR